ncbi:NtaA/DmoA family FMN-dependent monooxygenase [Roseibium suaedae]|uniref:FMN-dependent oxidoreductase, nitrilotriacetate monooxygenase family n=1 Tax=Roseibium suaedae TaxID=735517 RepID=A0A1M7MX49_9HYPH|nr:NtaA/DmoA family FMN-dependent monooxygenase [Roseibium suaedae]SHM95211.1 FMN-dependent oxidoreductase, nitrilotriacetate monooxygenase family [Roseibium suaedae]
MAPSKQLHIGMSLAPTWLSGDAWRRADSGVEGLFSSGFYLDIARRAEAAKIDFAFLPDSLFLHTGLLEGGSGFASLDPSMLLASIAHGTSKIGLLSTASTTFYPPYIVARQIQSLNWISNGRAGWNIVTALDGNGNFGLSEMPSPEERYARAAEFTEVVKRLWESFPREALSLDRDGGRFADAGLVRPIDHEGPFFSVKGPLNLPNFGKAPVPLVQAGASEAGRDFAASVADAIFASTPDKTAALDLRKDLRSRAEGHGRKGDDIRVLPGLSLYLASSRAEAQELFAETNARVSRARSLGTVREMTGLDLSDWPENRQVKASDLPPPPEKVRSRTHSGLLRRMIERDEPTVADLLRRPEVIGSAHWLVIGTPGDAVDAIRDWAHSGAIDGFVGFPGGSMDAVSLFLSETVPALTEQGLFRKDYSGSTFFDHLTENGC